MGRGYDYDASNSVHRLDLDAFPTFTPNFNTVILEGRGKPTDLIRSIPIVYAGYLISPKLRTVLERFALPAHRYYPVPMVFRSRPLEGYFWLHLPQPQFTLPADATITDAEAIIAGVPEMALLDLLRLYRPERFAGCTVTARLRQAIEAAKITGVRFATAKLFRAAAPHVADT